MKYHIYIQDEEAGDIAERLNPASEGVGYLVEDRFEAENFEGATTITQEWIAQRILSRPRDPVTVFMAELETGEHRRLKVTLPSIKSITEAVVWTKLARPSRPETWTRVWPETQGAISRLIQPVQQLLQRKLHARVRGGPWVL
jgi:hypothetical protein